MASDHRTTVQVEDETLNLTITPESEEEWKTAIRIIRTVAGSEGVEVAIEGSEGSDREPDADFFVGELEEVRSQLDSVERQVESVTDNFVSEQELDYKLEDFQEDLEESHSESVEADQLAEMQASIDMLEERIEEASSTGETGKGGEGDPVEPESRVEEDVDESEEPDSDNGEDSISIGEQEIPEIVDQGLVEVERPFNHEEFKALTKTEQEVAVFEAVREVQPGKKREIADYLYEKEISDSNTKQAQYIAGVLERLSEFLDTGEEEVNRGRNPTLYAESGFFDTKQVGESDEDVEESGDQSLENEDESADTSDEVEETEGEEEDGAPDLEEIEWKTIREASAEFRNEMSTSYLINKEERKSFTSPMVAQSVASTEGLEDWAAVEELPEEFKR
ncbi:hypothetical protein ACM16X_02675 [Haloarcula japonica]|uniref:hypothetical protein n=1 Tax=Haloarcula japonica TaxID=29282 RepID=UPI0039F709D6